MATLNNPTAARVVGAALRKLGVTPTAYTYSSIQFTNAKDSLNALLKEFQTMGMSAYLISGFNLPLAVGVSQYNIGELLPGSLPFPTYLYKVYMTAPDRVQTEMNQYSISDFSNLPDFAEGVPVNYNYLVGLQSAILQVWPTPDSTLEPGSQVQIWYQRPLDVVTGELSALDVPAEWENAVIYNLAVLLADEYGIPEQKKAWLEKQADKHLSAALSNTNEQGSFIITPNGEGWDYPNQY